MRVGKKVAELEKNFTKFRFGSAGIVLQSAKKVRKGKCLISWDEAMTKGANSKFDALYQTTTNSSG